MIQKINRLLIVLCSAFFMFVPAMAVQAATGEVAYGSAYYDWVSGEISPIGVYVRGDEPVASYEVCLTYDTSKLRYVEGASSHDGNMLYIRGTGDALEHKTMLRFEPLEPGDTVIQVVSAVCTTLPKPVEGVEGAENIETFVMTSLGHAPIHILPPPSTRLLELVTEPQNIVNFNPDELEYSIEVPLDVENLEISYVAEDERATVTVSDTVLEEGENTITVAVQRDEEVQVYVINVTRKEMVSEPVVEPEEPEETIEPEEPTEPVVPEDTVVLPEEDAQDEPETEEAGEQGIDWLLFDRFLLAIGCIVVAMMSLVVLFYMMQYRNRGKIIREQKGDKLKFIDMENTVIKLSHVTMEFKMTKDEPSSLKEYLIRVLKKQNEYIYLKALDDVSFEVKQGDVVGIIGTNGAGKSTMLKIVSGVLRPTKGKVQVDRSKVQMLTLGTGFDMELTARENVFLNGSIIGYSREYIEEKYDDIVKFAELEGFMDERMKNFSSGMVSRLGFAIATMRDTPDILILDEVLSVGDMFFQQKSEKRIKEMIHSGATVLIVSHSMNTIMKNCNKVVWIEKGVLQMMGDPKTVCEAYKNHANETV